jgi:peptidoglycan/LPS O-acetylase OafA/YrhL
MSVFGDFLRPVAAAERPRIAHADYRPDIDGLRAVAVLAVVAFHAFPNVVTGGFVGVDIFFVISGYLISRIILSPPGGQRFSFLGFYGRRIRRIFPALLAMLVLVCVFGRLILLSDEFQLLGKYVLAGAGFGVNIGLYLDTEEYFGAITSPLIHLWSLGVEEQFYFVWPLLLFATRRNRQVQLAILVAVTIASFIANVVAVSEHPLAAFYLPWHRLWELSIGGVVAHVELFGGIRFGRFDAGPFGPRSAVRWLIGASSRSVLGAVLLLAAIAFYHDGMGFPGWWALAPTIGAALVISAGVRAIWNRSVLSSRSMVNVGLISYPLYLLHWPILSFAHTMDWRQFTPAAKLGAILIAFILAALTYRYLEVPVRRARVSVRLMARLGVPMGACAAIGYLTFIEIIPPRPESAEVTSFVQAAEEPSPYPKQQGFLTLGDGPKRVLLLGDSTLAQYYSRAEKVLRDHPGNVRQAVFAWRAGCASDADMSLVDPAACRELVQKAMAYADDEQVDTIVIGFCWYAYFTGILDPDHVGEAGPLVPATERALAELETMVAGFVGKKKRVYILLQTPLNAGFPPLQMIRRTIWAPGFVLDRRPAAKAEIVQAFEPFVAKLRGIADRAGATVIDPMDALCDAEACPAATLQGEPIYHDSFHIRRDYVRDHIHYLDDLLLGDEPHAAAAQN